MEDRRIVIIGGGVAGISSAVHALARGWQPLILEASPGLGGRTRSFLAKDIHRHIDNGQHVLSAAYRETRHILDILGAAGATHFQDRLTINFRLNSQRQFLFRGWPLPAPFHFLAPLLYRAPLASPDRRFLKRFAWLYLRLSANDLKGLTVREWLDAAGDAPFLEKLLWEPLTLATLNTPVRQASAYLLYQVLRQAFLGSARRSGLGIPTTPLDEIFAGPATRYLGQHGGEIRLNTIVKRLIFKDDAIATVINHRDERIPVSRLVLAMPPRGLDKLLDQAPELRKRLAVYPKRFQYSPIITIYCWLKHPIEAVFPLLLVDSPIQWIFPLPPEKRPTAVGHGYAILISAAVDYVTMTDTAILEVVEREFSHYFLADLQNSYGLLQWKIVKEKRATFLQTPAALRLRPSAATEIPNLVLAGDWIDTDLPATIESAALSGRMAIQALD